MCIFCDIIAGKIPSEIIYRNEWVAAFRDINPQAPTHILIVPLKHIASLDLLDPADQPLVAEMVAAANELARREGIAEKGYRVAINCGEWGGQVVPHLHLHLLGGRTLSGSLG
jgi:histidine triad (HIT) family protein